MWGGVGGIIHSDTETKARGQGQTVFHRLSVTWTWTQREFYIFSFAHLQHVTFDLLQLLFLSPVCAVVLGLSFFSFLFFNRSPQQTGSRNRSVETSLWSASTHALCAEAKLVMRGYYAAEKTCHLPPPPLLSSARLISSLPLSPPVFLRWRRWKTRCGSVLWRLRWSHLFLCIWK